METKTYIGTLVIEHCCNCGVAFGLSNDTYKRRREDHEYFYCPNGHSQYYTGKSEAEQLRERIKEMEEGNAYMRRRNANLHDELTNQKHQTRAQKSAKTRMLNRVKNGVCPCCNRSFQNLKRHMEKMHPTVKRVE